MDRKSNSVIMKDAKKALNGKWSSAIGISLLYIFIVSVLQILIAIFEKPGEDLNFLEVINLILAFFAYPIIHIGYLYSMINLSRNNNYTSNDLFSAFDHRYWSIIYAGIISVVLLWSHLLFFIFPAVIVGLALSQVLYLLADDPNLTASDAIYKSVKMMSGFKWKLFKIWLRLFLLFLLCILTLGIGFLWWIPYSYVVNAKFYDYVNASPSPD
jgi:uncharacterized membrane protein